MVSAEIFGDEVPGELNGIGFEVVAEGEVAQHFEERVVAAGVADVFEVVVLAAGADALLGSGGAGVVAFFEALKNFLELVHAGVGEEQRRVVGGQERAAAHDTMPAGVEEIEKTLTDIVAGHRSPFDSLDSSIIGSGRLRGPAADGAPRIFPRLG